MKTYNEFFKKINIINEKYEKKIDELRQLSTNEGFDYIVIGNTKNDISLDSNLPPKDIIPNLKYTIEQFENQLTNEIDIDFVFKQIRDNN